MRTVTIELEYFDDLREFKKRTIAKVPEQIVIGFEGWRMEWKTEKQTKEEIIKEVERYFDFYIENQKNLPKSILDKLKWKAKNIFK